MPHHHPQQLPMKVAAKARAKAKSKPKASPARRSTMASSSSSSASTASSASAWVSASTSHSTKTHETSSSSQAFHHHHHQRLLPSHSSLSMGSSSSSVADPDALFAFPLQLLAYRVVYVTQGMFLGLLGPALRFFSDQAMQNAGINSPVASFGPIFAAHGGSALLVSFMSEIVLNVAVEWNLMKYLMTALLICSSGWFAGLTPVASTFGSLGVGVYFMAKGFWTALINISVNRCCLWASGEKIERGRSLVTSMNFAFGFGTVAGALLALVLQYFQIEFVNAFYLLAVMTMFPMLIVLWAPSPHPTAGRDENQTLLGYEDPSRRVPTVPSPIVGGVFLHVKHYAGRSANLNPDTYDSVNNMIILLVTIFATLLFGLQLGLGAFLSEYITHILRQSLVGYGVDQIQILTCTLMVVFWLSCWGSYVFFSKCMFHTLNLFSIFHLSLICMVSSFGLLFGVDTGVWCFTLCLVAFGFALSPLFTLSIHCLTRVINDKLIRRVSSLIVFGCGMGEIFLPVLMGFFMGDYSGQMYGSVAISIITFILSLCLVGVSCLLLCMVLKKLRANNQEHKETFYSAVTIPSADRLQEVHEVDDEDFGGEPRKHFRQGMVEESSHRCTRA